MNCELLLNTVTFQEQKVESVDSISPTLEYQVAIRNLREDRSAVVERARQLVESGELLTPKAAREAAKAILGLA
jgi:hypothetical protein